MVPAIFGISFDDTGIPFAQEFMDQLSARVEKIHVYEQFLPYLSDRVKMPENTAVFKDNKALWSLSPDMLISLGGDGTILGAVTLTQNSGIPILGINMGRLGFLSNVAKENVAAAVDSITNRAYRIEERSLLTLKTENNLFGDLNFALNELTILKKETSSMITIKTYVNDEYLNSYWADGLIIATPTGSTAYSLSCGGPILAPNSENVVLTPIAPHNLNVRPIVLSDNSKIRLIVQGRADEFLVSLDSRSETINSNTELLIERCSFDTKLVELHDQSFFATIRQKLLWGLDKRN